MLRFPAHSRRQQQDADERGVLRRGRGCDHGILGILEPRLRRAVRLRVDAVIAANDGQLAVEDPPNPWARMDVAIGDSSRREVHAIAAQHPVAVLRLVRELPDERVSQHRGRTEVRLVRPRMS